MKFCFSTKIKFILAVAVIFFTNAVSAQSNFNSAYSRFGLGLIESPGTFTHFGMGGVTTPLFDPYVVNFANPASYSFLDLTTLQVSIKAGYSKASTTETQSRYGGGQVGEMGFGFKKPGSKWGYAIGVAPFTSVDYSFKSTSQVNDSISTTYSYKGSGGLNKAIIGFSRIFRINDKKNKINTSDSGQQDSTKRTVHQIGLGANLNYVFGNITRQNSVFYDVALNFATQENINVWANGFILETGALYKVNLNTRLDEQRRIQGGSILQIGIDYMLNSNLASVYDQRITSVDSISNIIYTDTSFLIKNEKGQLKIPQRLAIGAAIKTYNKKWGTLTFAIDYKLQDWSRYRLATSTDANLDNGLKPSSTLALGVEFKPSSDIRTDFFHRLNYRVGIRSTETSLEIRDTRVKQQGVAAGLTIPIIKSTSKLHIGAEYGSTGTTSNGLVKENYMNFIVGFTLTPSAFDRWFRQIKYD